MGEENKIIVNDRRIKLDDEEEVSEAQKIAQKKMASDYQKVTNQKPSKLPQVNFLTFIMSLSSSALVHLGEVPDPQTKQTTLNLDLAKQTIDILGVLEEKTKGNLTSEEAKVLRDILFELRMKYIQKAE